MSKRLTISKLQSEIEQLKEDVATWQKAAANAAVKLEEANLTAGRVNRTALAFQRALIIHTEYAAELREKLDNHEKPTLVEEWALAVPEASHYPQSKSSGK